MSKSRLKYPENEVIDTRVYYSGGDWNVSPHNVVLPSEVDRYFICGDIVEDLIGERDKQIDIIVRFNAIEVENSLRVEIAHGICPMCNKPISICGHDMVLFGGNVCETFETFLSRMPWPIVYMQFLELDGSIIPFI